jgi:hypothetical protein
MTLVTMMHFEPHETDLVSGVKIAVTPEMVDAGAAVLLEHYPEAALGDA